MNTMTVPASISSKLRHSKAHRAAIVRNATTLRKKMRRNIQVQFEGHQGGEVMDFCRFLAMKGIRTIVDRNLAGHFFNIKIEGVPHDFLIDKTGDIYKVIKDEWVRA